jgi:hypothetical protein
MWMLKISVLMGRVSIHKRARHGLDLYKWGYRAQNSTSSLVDYLMADGAFPLVPLDPPGHDAHVRNGGGQVKSTPQISMS